MGLEAEELLAKVKRVKNVAVEGELKEKAVRFMAPREKESKKEELAFVESQLSPANSLPGHTMLSQDARKNLIGYSRFLKKDLAENVAPPVSGETRDALKTRLAFLDETIKQGMPTHEEQRRCPPGAVGKHTKWEAANKGFILERRNILHALEPDDDSEDLTNVEMLRPSMANLNGAPTFMADSVIPGVFAMSPQAKANWPLGEPKIDTALAQAERRELEELRAEKAAARADDGEGSQYSRLTGRPYDKAEAEAFFSKPKRKAREPKPPTPWTCPDCDAHLTLRLKGIHLAKHGREAKAAARDSSTEANS